MSCFCLFFFLLKQIKDKPFLLLSKRLQADPVQPLLLTGEISNELQPE